MRHLGTLLAASLLMALSGCGSGSGAGAEATDAATAARSSSSAPAAPSITAQQLSAAQDRLIEDNTGTFRVRFAGGMDSQGGDFFPAVDGSWSFAPLRMRTSMAMTAPDEGPVTVNQLTVGSRTFYQVLIEDAEDPMFTDTCWARLPGSGASMPLGTAPTPVGALLEAQAGAGGTTMRLADVFGSIGLQKTVTKVGAEAWKGRRVPVRIVLVGGRIDHWQVRSGDLAGAVKAMPTKDLLAEVRKVLKRAPNGVWTIQLSNVGSPVTIQEPPASALMTDEDRSACR